MIDEFFQKQLAPIVNVGAKPWRYRDTADSDTGGSLAQFQRAEEIRKVFFGGGARTATTRINFKPIDMDPAIETFAFEADEQVVTMNQGTPGVPRSIQWPGPHGTTQVKLQVLPSGTSMVFEGPWALHRMFDRATIEPLGGPDKFRATFQFDGKPVRVEVIASSVQNPFRFAELQTFRCPTTL